MSTRVCFVSWFAVSWDSLCFQASVGLVKQMENKRRLFEFKLVFHGHFHLRFTECTLRPIKIKLYNMYLVSKIVHILHGSVLSIWTNFYFWLANWVPTLRYILSFPLSWRQFISNKVGYKVIPVACGWAGAVFEVTRPIGKAQWSQKIQKHKKENVIDRQTDGRWDGWKDGRTKRGVEARSTRLEIILRN